MLDELLAAKRGGPTGPLSCRLWSGATTGRGYPVARTPEGNRQVRRLVYQREKRLLLPGERVEMQCGERLCLEPSHMHATPGPVR